MGYRQEDQQFRVILCYLEMLRPTWVVKIATLMGLGVTSHRRLVHCQHFHLLTRLFIWLFLLPPTQYVVLPPSHQPGSAISHPIGKI